MGFLFGPKPDSGAGTTSTTAGTAPSVPTTPTVPSESAPTVSTNGSGTTPDVTPPETIQVCSTCNQVLVQFRPHAAYAGEFGFDWIRLGDTSMYGDALPYEDVSTIPTTYNMLGKYYEKSKVDKKGVVNYSVPITDTNGWKVCVTTTEDKVTKKKTKETKIVSYCKGTESIHWKVSPTQYSTLTQRFKTLSIPWKVKVDPKFNYYVPILTLLPDEEIDNGDGTFTVIQGNSAKLAVHIEVSIASSHIKLKPKRKDTGVAFRVDGIVSDNLTINAGVHDAHLEVRCTKALSSNLDVDIYADDKLCGRFTILQNDSSVVVNKKILLVKVESDFDINIANKIGSPKSGGKELLDNCLKQALIKADIELYSSTLDVTSVKTKGKHEFRDKFCTGVKVKGKRVGPYKINKDAGKLLAYLNAKFKSQFPKKRYDYVVYFIGESGNWNGFAQSPQKAGVYFPTHRKSTIAHELFHAMGLPHTFTNSEANSNAKFTYKATMTNNLMDYSHFKHKPRFLTYHWQWKILNGRVPNA